MAFDWSVQRTHTQITVVLRILVEMPQSFTPIKWTRRMRTSLEFLQKWTPRNRNLAGKRFARVVKRNCFWQPLYAPNLEPRTWQKKKQGNRPKSGVTRKSVPYTLRRQTFGLLLRCRHQHHCTRAPCWFLFKSGRFTRFYPLRPSCRTVAGRASPSETLPK